MVAFMIIALFKILCYYFHLLQDINICYVIFQCTAMIVYTQ